VAEEPRPAAEAGFQPAEQSRAQVAAVQRAAGGWRKATAIALAPLSQPRPQLGLDVGGQGGEHRAKRPSLPPSKPFSRSDEANA
jgi:hypothetical protein